MGSSPLVDYMHKMGLPYYGQRFDSIAQVSRFAELFDAFLEKHAKNELKSYDYDVMLVTETFGFTHNGYIFGHPSFDDGTLVKYQIYESSWISSYNLHKATLDGLNCLVVGRHKLTKARQ